MTEKELIAKIQELRQLKPRQDWVVLTKNRLFAAEETNRDRVSVSWGEVLEGLRIILSHKYAFSSLVLMLVMLGVFGFSQNSLPGDSLYSLKRITEKSQEVFISEKDLLQYNLGIANKRLDDLTKVVENNSAKNLGSAINEFQASVSKAAESLVKTDLEKKPQAVKEIALEVKRLEEKADKIKSLGVEIGENKEMENALSQLVEEQIKDLEARTLTENQGSLLEEAKAFYEAGDYSQALIKILYINE